MTDLPKCLTCKYLYRTAALAGEGCAPHLVVAKSGFVCLGMYDKDIRIAVMLKDPLDQCEYYVNEMLPEGLE